MIRNILYSLFLHSALITIIYYSFSFNPPIEIDKTTKVAISFVVKPINNPNNENATTQIVQSPKNTVAVQESISKEIPLTKKVNLQPKKHKKFKPKAIKKILETNPKIIAEKSPKLKKNDIIKPEIQAPEVETKEPEIIPEEIKTELDDVETIPETKDQEDENQYSFTQNNIESLNLLVREKFNIQNQIKRCYQNALKEDGDNKVMINVHIFIAQDGFINLDSIIFKEFSKYQNKDLSKTKDTTEEQASLTEYQKAIETVKKALKFCNPIRNLPQDKYNIWKEIDLQFN